MNLPIIAFFCNDKKNSVLLLFPEHVHQGVSALLTLPPCLLACCCWPVSSDQLWFRHPWHGRGHQYWRTDERNGLFFALATLLASSSLVKMRMASGHHICMHHTLIRVCTEEGEGQFLLRAMRGQKTYCPICPLPRVLGGRCMQCTNNHKINKQKNLVQNGQIKSSKYEGYWCSHCGVMSVFW